MSTRKELLEFIKKSEIIQRKAINHEIKTLHTEAVKQIAKIGIDEAKQQILTKLNNNIQAIKDLNNAVKAHQASDEFKDTAKWTTPYPLLTNKLEELYKCAKVLVQDFETLASPNLFSIWSMDDNTQTQFLPKIEGSWAARSEEKLEQDLFNSIKSLDEAVKNNQQEGFKITQIADIKGTSLPNCIQVALLEISDIEIDADKSATLQTTKLPVGFTLPNSFSSSSFYYSKAAENYAPQGELLNPHLGFSFGGTRRDEKYADKEFKAHDASSAVAEWLGLGIKDQFATYVMKMDFSSEACQADSLCVAASKTLEKVTSTKEEKLIPGNIALIGALTGVVTKIDGNNFELYSCNRDMYFVEGCGYNNYIYADDQLFFAPRTVAGNNSHHDEL